ncbi:hypothetical protein CC78DRAFT_102149 [Lojkania enalia]|uniref:C2H2-type domain-containing protein n=1 Tax=Lojkania enalia TaxID=147567 RepID=A0A9P4N5G5_9PLEO|nr:hypothetical protein CC78DRAFT_102149 [Didymosphaeria enalia]
MYSADATLTNIRICCGDPVRYFATHCTQTRRHCLGCDKDLSNAREIVIDHGPSSCAIYAGCVGCRDDCFHTIHTPWGYRLNGKLDYSPRNEDIPTQAPALCMSKEYDYIASRSCFNIRARIRKMLRGKHMPRFHMPPIPSILPQARGENCGKRYELPEAEALEASSPPSIPELPGSQPLLASPIEPFEHGHFEPNDGPLELSATLGSAAGELYRQMHQQYDPEIADASTSLCAPVGRYDAVPIVQAVARSNLAAANSSGTRERDRVLDVERGTSIASVRAMLSSLATPSATVTEHEPLTARNQTPGIGSVTRGDDFGESHGPHSIPSAQSAGIPSSVSHGSCGSCGTYGGRYDPPWDCSSSGLCSTVSQTSEQSSTNITPTTPQIKSSEGAGRSDYPDAVFSGGDYYGQPRPVLNIPTRCSQEQRYHTSPRGVPLYDTNPPEYSSPSSAVQMRLWPGETYSHTSNQRTPHDGMALQIMPTNKQQEAFRLEVQGTNGLVASYSPHVGQCLPRYCQQCNQKFTGTYSKGNLDRHRREKHSGSSAARSVYKCSSCHKKYKRADARKKHEWEKHGRGLEPKKRLERKRPDGQAYELPVVMD